MPRISVLCTESQHHQSARTAMNGNMIGIPQIEDVYKISLNKAQRETLERIPFSTRLLNVCSDSHRLIVDMGFSAAQTCEHLGKLLVLPDAADDPCAKDALVFPQWLLVSKSCLPGTLGQTFFRQSRLIPQGERPMSVREAVYVTITEHCLGLAPAYHQRVMLRTRTKGQADLLKVVTSFNGTDLMVMSYLPDKKQHDLGIRTSRQADLTTV